MEIPIDEGAWHSLGDYYSVADLRLPAGHRIEYARTGDGMSIVVRIVGPNAHVWGKSEAGTEGLRVASEKALEWFSTVGREL